MYHIKQFPIPALLAATALLCPWPATSADAPPRAAVRANTTNTFTVTGMHCNGCASGLTHELNQATGVASATVSLTNRLATVAFDASQTSVTNLLKVIEAAGFKGKQVTR